MAEIMTNTETMEVWRGGESLSGQLLPEEAVSAKIASS